MAVKQTAGRDSLGTFAPEFVHLNDDILFGEVWSREEKLSLRDRSLVTVVSLMSQGSAMEHFRTMGDADKSGLDTVTSASVVVPGNTAMIA
ncbi:carboxymuconolactone decarboxylase family protein [Treponema sp.]|uniref:carboxymuconolactone decarboxylase family protein n=1 Tax=Treponema sp. TaxID=166 RepID=UPI003FD6D26D